MTRKTADKVVLIALILQIAFIMYMNLFRADTIIDFDCASAYMHEMEMGRQGKIFPSEYSYQASMDLDGAAVISAFFYHFTDDIFLSRGIANSIVVILYICVAGSVLTGLGLPPLWKRFGILLFLIPYSMIILGYWRMLFTGGGFFAFRALVPLLLVSMLVDMDRGKSLAKCAPTLVLYTVIVFLTGLSSGPYVLLCAVCPLILWELVRAFIKADPKQIISKRSLLAVAGVLASCAGMILQKAVGFSSTADSKVILTSDKWIDAILSSFAGIFELFGGLTVHKDVRLFSPEGVGTAVDFAVTCILITAIIYTLVVSVKKKAVSDMNGYIFSLMLVNALMFSFLDLKYGVTVFESRYHLIPMLPSFFMLAAMMDDISKSGRFKAGQAAVLQAATIVLFLASMLYGDAQFVYAKTALGSDKLVELNRIMEEEGVNTAVVVGEDSKDLGRKLRVYGKDTHYIVVDDGAKSAFRTTWGGTTRYLDNAMQDGKTAVIATPESYETLPAYLVSDMKYLREYDGLQIYVGNESRFDCVGGIVPEKDRVVDFPYSPGYSCENAMISDEGALVMAAGGGTLLARYPSAEGTWDYSLYYDMTGASGDAFMEIGVGEDAPVRVELDPEAGLAVLKDVAMKGGETVSFLVSAPQGTRIEKTQISRSR